MARVRGSFAADQAVVAASMVRAAVARPHNGVAYKQPKRSCPMHFPAILLPTVLLVAACSLESPKSQRPTPQTNTEMPAVLDPYDPYFPPVFATLLPAAGLRLNADNGASLTARNVAGVVTFFQGATNEEASLSEEERLRLLQRVMIMLHLKLRLSKIGR